MYVHCPVSSVYRGGYATIHELLKDGTVYQNWTLHLLEVFDPEQEVPQPVRIDVGDEALLLRIATPLPLPHLSTAD